MRNQATLGLAPQKPLKAWTRAPQSLLPAELSDGAMPQWCVGQICHQLERGGQRRGRGVPSGPLRAESQGTSSGSLWIPKSGCLKTEGFLVAHPYRTLGNPPGAQDPSSHSQRVSGLGFGRHSFSLLQRTHTCTPFLLYCRGSKL